MLNDERPVTDTTTVQKHDNSSRNDQSGDSVKSHIFERHDVLIWISGVCVIGLICGAMIVTGREAGWNNSRPYLHDAETSRFLPEPEYCNETYIKGRHGERCTGRWYYWKLPATKVTTLTRATVWICYSSHQIILWIGIYLGQSNVQLQDDASAAKYGIKLSKYNWLLLATNLVFFFLHLGQTHWTYDGLAQDVSLASSEGAVIMILALVLLLEWKSRGIAFMLPTKDSTLRVSKPVLLARKYHGYLISWAITYTFWYHPMENTTGHILGFIHAGMILLQGSLLYTRFHLNRYWRLIIETWVVIHGCIISYETRNPNTYRQQWPLYFLGFGFILSCTQIFGLQLWKKIHYAFRVVPLAIFLIVAFLLCHFDVIRGSSPQESNFSKLKEIFYIPLEMYILMFSLWAFLFVWIKLTQSSDKNDGGAISSEDTVELQVSLDTAIKLSQLAGSRASRAFRRIVGMGGFLAIHAFMITVSYFIHWADLDMSNTSIMFMLVALFSLCWSIAIMTLKLSVERQ